jgi:hypothetical protein
LLNTIIAQNTGNAPDVSGAFLSLGHNLIGATDGSSGFPMSGDLVGSSDFPLDPNLGPLTNNGGPTLTMALLPGSPAIDAGDNSVALLTDQRGFPRVVGPAMDIGAYEYCYLPVLQIGPLQTGVVSILVYGLPNQSCRLLTSSALANWLPIATNQISTNGMTTFQDGCAVGQTCRFYRVMMP